MALIYQYELAKCVVGKPVFIIPDSHIPYKESYTSRGVGPETSARFPLQFGNVIGFGTAGGELSIRVQMSDDRIIHITDASLLINI